MDARTFTREAEQSGTTPEQAADEFDLAELAHPDRGRFPPALRRMVTEDEVASVVLAMLGMPGPADIDLSAGMAG